MKKILFFAVMLAVSTGMTAKPKAGKADAATAATAQTNGSVNIKSGSDSLSYAAGYAQTNGLIPYLQQQYSVDTTYMADFIQGLRDAKENINDPRYVARMAGAQIAQLIEDRMIKGMNKELEGTPDNISRDLFYNGFIAALSNDTSRFNMESAGKFFQTKFEADRKIKEAKIKEDNAAWLKENQTKQGVVTTASGLQYKVVTMGTGERPTADQEVEVKYEGKLIDGTVFDSSYKRNPQTSKFKCNQVIKGWTEGLQLMPVGSKFEFYIPYDLAYGERGQGQRIPPYSTLIFTVELVGITK